MVSSSLTLLALIPSFLLSTVSATPQHQYGAIPAAGRLERRIVANMTDLAERQLERRASSLSKRAGGFTGRATWYEAGLGACGWVNKGSDKIVALGQNIFDSKQPSDGNPNNNGWCGTKICITYGNVQAEAEIVDLCPYSGGCSASDGAALDMSQSLFQEFAGLGVGVFYMDWAVGSCGSGSAPSSSDSSSQQQDQSSDDSSDSKKSSNNDDGAAQKQAQAKADADAAAAAAAASSSSAAAAAAAASQSAEAEAAAQASRAAEDAAASSSAAQEARLASIASESAASVASVASVRQERIEYFASVSSASEARMARISAASDASVASVSAVRSQYYAAKSQASVVSKASVRSEYFESKSQVSAASARSERIESLVQASKSAAPVVAAGQDALDGLAALIGATPTPRPSASA